MKSWSRAVGWTKRLLVLSFSAWVSISIPCRSVRGETVTFIVTSDAHYDAFENEDRNERNAATIDEMNRIDEESWPDRLGGGPIAKPRGVLALGDLIDDGDRILDGKKQSLQQWQYYVADFGLDGTDGRLEYPVYDGWGNHDGPPVGRERFGFSFQTHLRERNALRKERGLVTNVSDNGLHYSWDWGPVHLVQLNLYPGNRPHPATHYSPAYHDPQGSLDFLKDDLASCVGASGRPVVLVHHYDLQGTDWWHPEERLAYRDAIAEYNGIAIFHGHTGTGVYQWKTPDSPRTFDVVNTGQTENGFFVVEISPDRMRTAYRVKRREGGWTWAHPFEKPIRSGRAAPASRGLSRPLTDKTLVAWVEPEGATQRGGSVLTLMEGEDFDAVVLGERVEGRWMAGSDFFRRTQGPEGQAASPSETAEPGALVQVAVVYSGKQISIYRDGKPYASYSIEKPRAFGPDAFVLIGLRYLGSMGPIGFFQGSVEEARIYDRALDESTLVALKPGAPSAVKPIACWSFEDGSTADSQGTFPPGELCGGAKVEGGRLHLNGSDAYLVSRVPAPAPRMFYAPSRPETGRMWDTWLYWREGVYYLFYLANSSKSWDNISMATSRDGVRWNELGPILRKADGVTWMGTGFTWRSPRYEEDGRFFLNFSEWRGDRQTIFFAESTDLLNWKRLGDELEFRQDERWYEPKGRWDCIYAMPREEGGLWGWWTADPKGRPGVGFGASADGVRWEALEPPLFLDGAPHGEAGAVERIGDRYYLLLGSGGNVLALVADRPQGPFRPQPKNLVLLHKGPTYFARFFPTNPDGILVNHHAIARDGRVHLGLLKTATVDAEGTLRLGWWKGNDALKREEIAVKPPDDGEGHLAFLPTSLPADEGVVLEGTLALPDPEDPKPRGLYLETFDGAGVAIRVDSGGVVEIGTATVDAAPGDGFRPEIRVDREVVLRSSVPFRLCLERRLLELYLGDLLVECYALPSLASGRVGLIGPMEAFGELRAWR